VRAETFGLISAENRTIGAYLVGVDPATEGTVTRLPATLTEGHWIDAPCGPHVPTVLGATAARRLRVSVGGELTMMTQAADGSIAAELFDVCGISETGSDDLDGSTLLLPVSDLQSILELGTRVHRIVILTDSLRSLHKVESRLEDLSPNTVALKWTEILPELDHTIRTDKQGQHVFLVIMILVVGLGISNTMFMSVLERTREFGVLTAIGTTPGQVLRLLLMEAFWLALLGTGLGVAVASVLNIYTAIPLVGGELEFSGVKMSVMQPANNLRGNVVYPLIILVTAVIAGVIPGLRASRMNPSEALRAS
jgi:putative ABC transport system permease protein